MDELADSFVRPCVFGGKRDEGDEQRDQALYISTCLAHTTLNKTCFPGGTCTQLAQDKERFKQSIAYPDYPDSLGPTLSLDGHNRLLWHYLETKPFDSSKKNFNVWAKWCADKRASANTLPGSDFFPVGMS